MSILGAGIVRFFNRYKRFVDLESYKRDTANYKKRLDGVYRLTSEVDYAGTILVLHKASIYKEIFLWGFTRIPEYTSYRYLNIGDLRNIAFMNSDNVSEIDAYGGIVSTSQLIEGVLCLTLNCYESPNKQYASLCNEVIINRVEGSLRDVGTSPKYNWIFYRGDLSGIKAHYRSVYDLFMSDDYRVKFHVYDLNTSKKKLILDKVKETAKKGNDLFDI